MRIIIISILLTFFASINIYSQDLPKDFWEKTRNEYLSISQDVRQTELNLTFEEFLASKTNSYRKKQQFYTSISGLRSINNLCDNGTFENGDINTGDWNFYWEGQQGALSGTNKLNTGSFNTGGAHNTQVHHSAVSIGADPYFGSLNRVWNFPSGNTTSLRLGNANSGCGLESIAKVVTITPSNAIFTFSYAMVMDNPAGHGNALPFFEVNIIDAITTTTNYNNLINLGNNSNRISSNNPLLQPNNTNAQRRWKDWTCVTSDLSSLIGQTVIIELGVVHF